MEIIFKEFFIVNNEVLFNVLCGSIIAMIIICFMFAIKELKNK